jgi:TctA family transporter
VASLILELILGAMLGKSFRPSLSTDGPTIFFGRSLSYGSIIAVFVLAVVPFKFLRRVPEKMLKEDETKK